MTIPKHSVSWEPVLTWAGLVKCLESDFVDPAAAHRAIYLKQPGPPGLTIRQELAARFVERLASTWLSSGSGPLGVSLDILIKSEGIGIVKASFALADAILADGKADHA